MSWITFYVFFIFAGLFYIRKPWSKIASLGLFVLYSIGFVIFETYTRKTTGYNYNHSVLDSLIGAYSVFIPIIIASYITGSALTLKEEKLFTISNILCFLIAMTIIAIPIIDYIFGRENAGESLFIHLKGYAVIIGLTLILSATQLLKSKFGVKEQAPESKDDNHNLILIGIWIVSLPTLFFGLYMINDWLNLGLYNMRTSVNTPIFTIANILCSLLIITFSYKYRKHISLWIPGTILLANVSLVVAASALANALLG